MTCCKTFPEGMTGSVRRPLSKTIFFPMERPEEPDTSSRMWESQPENWTILVDHYARAHTPGSDILGAYWHDIVELYSIWKLTFPKDKLPAISGVAQEMKSLLSDEYLADTWKGNLLPDLLWKVRYGFHPLRQSFFIEHLLGRGPR
jgi:hypothetical protein